ncbi:hypothetical protein F3G63_34420, partial [Pseudomonas aeruginosa]
MDGTMHGISSIIYIILVACMLPYAFTVIAKFTGGFQPVDNQNPRDFLANTKGIAARANAVQQNSFESLPLFLTAILMAEYMVVPEYFILRLGWAYIILRVIYGICY